MSGSRAKAKRKSAKKAAVNSAPVPVRAQTDFIIENVRCFAGEQRVPIRPITLLVGENSTGKTTFAACCYVAKKFASALGGSANGLGFNTPPFSMSGFREIVRRSGNGRSCDEFRLGFAVPHPKAGALASMSLTFKGKSAKSAVSDESDTDLAGVSFAFADGASLEIAEKKPNIMTIAGPDFRILVKGSMPQAPSADGLLVWICFFLARENKKSGKLSKSDRDARKKLSRFFDEKFGMSIISEGIVKTLPGGFGGTWLMSTALAKALAPVRSKPEWTYSLFGERPEAEGGDIPASLLRLSRSHPDKWQDLRKRLVDFGKKSNMFSYFNVVPHGARAGGDFHLEVKTRARGARSNIAGVGYGVSQIYPLLIPVMRASQKGAPMVLFLQEPEIHLHPKAQAALASFFTESAKKDGHNFIIETHGDSIIDRVRVCVRRGEIAPEDVVVLYFDPDKKTGAVKIHPIHLDELGNVLDAPVGYRQFFLDETDRLLGFKE